MQTAVERLKELTILYCEDEEPVREVMVSVLGKLVRRLIVAEDGEQGLALFAQHADEIDIILTDISMPGMNGLEMVRTIKKTHPNLPVIVTTAFSNREFLLEAIDNNVDKYVLKPVDMAKLIEAINQSLLYHETRYLYKDPLTGLPNRQALLRDMAPNMPHTVALLDIDRFSEINLIYGEAAADRVLIAYARQLKEAFGDAATVYRDGADSFALLFHDPDYPIEQIEMRLTEFIDTVENAGITIDDDRIYILTVATVAHQDPQAFNHAQRTMIASKKSYRRLNTFRPNQTERGRYEEDIRWVHEIKTAIRTNRLKPFYQPIYDTQTQKVVKFEALLRYRMEDGSPIDPQTFLAIAKRVRMYASIIRTVLKDVIEVIRQWQIRVSVNISYEDISNPETVRFIHGILSAHPEQARLIDFEILESEIFEDYESVKAFIEQIRRYGCGIGVDDFGSGYTNFSLLEELEVDFIKIDGSLIMGIAEKVRQKLIVESIQMFAGKLGIPTVAEMVSDAETYAVVRELGIDYTQGWYFAKAIDASELEQYAVR